MFLCIKCGEKIPEKRKSKKYCSPNCCKLFLKSEYRKRNREKINAYNRKQRRAGIRGNPSTNTIISKFKDRNRSCAKCGTAEDLHVCHIKPRHLGGRNKDNLIVLCRKHHHQFDRALKEFWNENENRFEKN